MANNFNENDKSGLKSAESSKEAQESKPNIPAITPTSSVTTGDATTNPAGKSEPVGTVLPAVHLKSVDVTDELRAAREDSRERLAPEIHAAKQAQKRQEELLTPGEADTVSITLKQSHTHSGVAYKAGDTMKVDEQAAAFIEQHGIGERS